MIIECTEQYKQALLEYMTGYVKDCLYLYVDFLKYGFTHKHIHIYAHINNEEQINKFKFDCIMLQYHSGLHIFSQSMNFDVEEICEKIYQLKPSMICGTLEFLAKLKPYLTNYDLTSGKICKINQVNFSHNNLIEKANITDFKEIVKLICSDSGLGGSTNIIEMEKQLKERYNDKFSRSYILRDNDNIIAHVDTNAEIDDLAIISGVITDISYRGKGYAKDLLAKLAVDLLSEGKQVYSIYYTSAAEKMHKRVGFVPITDWAKLTVKKI